MRCVDCGENEATIIWVQGTGVHTDVRRAGDRDEAESAGPREPRDVSAASTAASGGPNVCESCARRRYEKRRDAAIPWKEFRRRYA